jgi:hypothetical protein
VKRRSSRLQSGINDEKETKHLLHETSLAIAVGVNLGVELVHEGRLGLVVVRGTVGGTVSGGALIADLVTKTLTGRLVAETSAGVGMVVGGVGASQTSASKTSAGGVRATDGAGLTLESIVTLLTTSQDTTLLLEVGHADSGEGRGAVVLSGIVVNLVDGDGGVDNVGLNRLLVDNGLDGLVDVVVDVLAANRGGNGLSVLGLNLDALVSKLSGLGGETLLDLGVVAVLERAVLDGGKVVVVLLGKNLAVLDGLDRGVVVVLVNLLVDGSLDLLVLLELVGLVDNSGGNLLVDGGVVVTRLGPGLKSASGMEGKGQERIKSDGCLHEVLNGSLGGFHCDD